MRIEHPPVFPAPRPRPAGPVFKANDHIVDANKMVSANVDYFADASKTMPMRKTPTLADELATAKRIITKWLQGGYA